MTYNPPFYVALMEGYGFQKAIGDLPPPCSPTKRGIIQFRKHLGGINDVPVVFLHPVGEILPAPGEKILPSRCVSFGDLGPPSYVFVQYL